MLNHTVPAATEGMPGGTKTAPNTFDPSVANEADPVLALACRLRSAMLIEEDLESRRYASAKVNLHSAVSYPEKAEQHASDAVSGLRDMITREKATSLAGALVHVAELSYRIDAIWDELPETDYLRRTDYRAAQRMVYSVLDLLEAASGCKLADLVSETYGSPYYNPWVPVEERCDELREAAR